MRIVYVSNGRFPSEKAHTLQIVKMCEAFSSSGADVTLVSPHRVQPDARLSATSLWEFYGTRRCFNHVVLRNVDVLSGMWKKLPAPLIALLVGVQSVLWPLSCMLSCGRFRADLFYTRDLFAALWLSLRGYPIVFELHQRLSKSERWILRRLSSLAAFRGVVTVTSHLREEVLGCGWSPKKVLVWHDGADLSLYRNLPSPGECRAAFGLPEGGAIIGYLGRFETMGKEKGLLELIHAFADLVRTHTSAMLLCVGGPMSRVPQYLKKCEELSIPRESVRFVDRVPQGETPRWLQCFSIAAAPFPWTEHYAFAMSPLKIFEYLAAGLPIVASDLPALREVLEDGVNAVLVAPGSTSALAKALAELVESEPKRVLLGAAARETSKNYSWAARAREIIRVFSGEGALAGTDSSLEQGPHRAGL